MRERQYLSERKVNAPPSPIEIINDSHLSVMDLLFSYSPELIAEQLTLIDFATFKEIQVPFLFIYFFLSHFFIIIYLLLLLNIIINFIYYYYSLFP